ncbi:transposase [Chitinophaga sp. S165]|uniref:IS66 family transposase n=1 Tax=Chitinophaga sp. S165 TaxID=2135462 RepID=UPI000D86EEC0|nr:transposase [Chitinophaga sp. S165]PWV48107.1 transposase [Chitinophaga sp. S165]
MKKFSEIVFGSKRDRFIGHPSQLLLELDTTESYPSSSLNEAKKVTYVKEDKRTRRALSSLGTYLEKLPRVYETRELDHLPAGAEKIGEEKHEILEYTPGKLFVRVITTPRYKIGIEGSLGQTLIITAPDPQRPLFKCVAGASLLAQLVTAKYCDHLPLYRQNKAFEWVCAGLPYNTIVDWTAKAAELLSPLYEALKKDVLKSTYIHVDETTLKVICAEENKTRNEIHDGFLWCYTNSIEKLMFFDYQPGRGQNCTIGILKNFKGIIQTDGWQVYKKVAAKQQDITPNLLFGSCPKKFHLCPDL